MCIMSVFRREVVDAIGGFDERFKGNEDYHFWLRAAHAGFRIVQNRRPLGQYRRRTDSVSADQRRMLGGIMRVLRDAHEMCRDHPNERSSIERQLNRFQGELTAAEMAHCLRQGDAVAAARFLGSLSTLKGRVLPAAARLSATWPRPLLWMYQLRRMLRNSPSARRVGA